MSVAIIRKLMETRLAAMSPALATAWENSTYTPVAGVPYQRVEFLRAEPETPTMDTFRREIGIMQVTLMYPLNKGAGDAESRAELIRAQFPKALRLSGSGINVDFASSPHVMSGFRDEDRWAAPVRVRYFSNIS